MLPVRLDDASLWLLHSENPQLDRQNNTANSRILQQCCKYSNKLICGELLFREYRPSIARWSGPSKMDATMAQDCFTFEVINHRKKVLKLDLFEIKSSNPRQH
jgi:hypothetical protein